MEARGDTLLAQLHGQYPFLVEPGVQAALEKIACAYWAAQNGKGDGTTLYKALKWIVRTAGLYHDPLSALNVFRQWAPALFRQNGDALQRNEDPFGLEGMYLEERQLYFRRRRKGTSRASSLLEFNIRSTLWHFERSDSPNLGRERMRPLEQELVGFQIGKSPHY